MSNLDLTEMDVSEGQESKHLTDPSRPTMQQPVVVACFE